MSETARSRRSMNPVLKRFRFQRFSTVQLLIALAVLLMSAPFVEELEGGHLILSVLFSLVLLAGVFAVADRKRTLAIALILAVPAITARWINYFRPDLVAPCCFSRLCTPAVGVCDRASAAFHSACTCRDRGCALRKHRSLPDAGLDVDGRLLARGSGYAWRGFFVQHGAGRALDERIYRILF